MPGASTDSRYQALLSVTEHLAVHHQLDALLNALRTLLEPLIPFSDLALVLHRPKERLLQLRVLASSTPGPTPVRVFSEGETPVTGVLSSQSALYVSDVQKETSFPAFHDLLRAKGIRAYCMVPVSSGGRNLGALNFGSLTPDAYSVEDLEFIQAVGRQISVAVDNTIGHEKLARERDRLAIILDVNNALVSHRDERSLFQAVSTKLRERLGADYVSLLTPDSTGHFLERRIMDFPTGAGVLREGGSLPIAGTDASLAFRSGEAHIFNAADIAADAVVSSNLQAEGLSCICALPLRSRQQILGTLNLGSRSDAFFCPDDLPWLEQIAGQVAIALDNASSYQRVEELNARLAKEKLYLEDEIRSNNQFEEIIGESPAIGAILRQIETVAPTGSTVLLFGETGTGKELLARAIHDLSDRKSRTFVKLNCAAIPTGLLESELFGHERGAFTGAIAQRIGRFELANGGTIFLDEIGEVPLELQSKLLRVLQEQEFERLGSSRTIKVDARLVAATNRNLEEMVAHHQFRADLFYRLNVFPVHIPPLRERQDDIPLLVRYFAQQFARRMNRIIDTIPSASMTALKNYAWPGNIRELQNLIERAVILSTGNVLNVPVAELRAQGTSPSHSHAPHLHSGDSLTLESAERAAILRALKESGGKVGGDTGAASKLGMKRTTLQARMRKLGLTPKSAASF